MWKKLIYLPNCSWAESPHHSTLNIDCMKAIDIFIAWGYIDFSLWLFFSTDTGKGSSFQMMRRRFLKERIWKQVPGRTEVKSCRVAGVTRTCWATLPPSCSAAGGGHLFLVRRGFDLFASASASFHLQRPWKRMSNSSVCVHFCVS